MRQMIKKKTTKERMTRDKLLIPGTLRLSGLTGFTHNFTLANYLLHILKRNDKTTKKCFEITQIICERENSQQM